MAYVTPRLAIAFWVTVGSACIALFPAYAQTTSPRSFDALRSAVPQATAPEALQIRVRWLADRPAPNPAQATNQFQVIAMERVSPGAQRDRRPEVTPQNIVVVTLDKAGVERDWRIVQDPRVVRSESEALGALRGETLYYMDSELLLVVPALPDGARLQLYKVFSSNGVAMLDPFGQIDLP
jgi:hypothetical protein